MNGEKRRFFLMLDKQDTRQTDVPQLLDHPKPIPWRYRPLNQWISIWKRRFLCQWMNMWKQRSSSRWISIVSAALILAMVVIALEVNTGKGAVILNTKPGAIATPPIAGQATPMPTPTAVHRVIVDDLNDWSKVYSHTANLWFDRTDSKLMDGDKSVLTRKAKTPEEVVWKLPGLTFFQAITYFLPSESGSPLSDLSVYVSADGMHWRAARPTLSRGPVDWTKYIYTLKNLSNVDFVQMRWSVTAHDYWAEPVGQVTLKS